MLSNQLGHLSLLHELSQSPISLLMVAWSMLDCARRTSTFHIIDPSKLACFLSWNGTHVGLRAAVERGPSEGARSGSTGPTWVSFHLL